MAKIWMVETVTHEMGVAVLKAKASKWKQWKVKGWLVFEKDGMNNEKLHCCKACNSMQGLTNTHNG